jgi:muramoyltetrapeptide carboxypeptidase
METRLPDLGAQRAGRMSGQAVRIGVVAPACGMEPATAERVTALAARSYGARVELVFHPQCFLRSGHFAGDDAARAAAFLEVANDPSFDAVWFGRGGYGSGRLLELAMPALGPAAGAKAYLGYSDLGSLLGALYARHIGQVAHGPMPQDIARTGGEAAVARALAWLVDKDPAALEPSIGKRARPSAAFNMAVLSALIGTAWQPDLEGHVLMLEEVGEYMYRIDRFMFHITSNAEVRRAAGIRLGRCSDIPNNDPDFVLNEEQVVEGWCKRAGIVYLGRADIGHDADNRVVPFGRSPQRRPVHHVRRDAVKLGAREWPP